MSEFRTDSLDKITTEATSLNCDVFVAESNQLQFDLDTPDAEARFFSFYCRKLCPRFGDDLKFASWKSKSDHLHVTVTLPEPLGVVERIALQAQGGSDPGREFAALCCHWDGSQHPVLLFKPKPKQLEAKKVLALAAESVTSLDLNLVS